MSILHFFPLFSELKDPVDFGFANNLQDSM